MKVSFIGLGIMGSRMATHLLENKVDLTVYNRSPEPMETLSKKGAKTSETLREAVKEADVVFSMLANPDVVSEVFLHKDGALQHMKKGSLWVDCSTVNPSFSLKCNKRAGENEISFADAPVAGSKPQAEAAELAIFFGGEEVDLKKAKPYLEMMGKKVIHVGEQGKGTSLKMVVNMLLGQSMLMFSEALLFGEKMGIDKSFLLENLPGMAVTPPFIKAKADKIKNGDYAVQFPLELMHKDLHLASLSAYEVGQPIYLANLTKEIFGAANNKGLNRDDFSAIYRYLNEHR